MQARQNPILVKRAAEQQMLFEPKFEFTVKRTKRQSDLKFARIESAKEAVGKIDYNCDRYIVSKGQFSLIELIEVVIEQTGPVDCVISTWTAAGADIAEAFTFINSGKLLSCRFLVDYTFQRRKPEFCGQLRKLFGDEAIRVSKNHAKMVLLSNKNWSINILTSMNLNKNPRMEYCLIRENADLLNFNLEWINHLFKIKKSSDITQTETKWHEKKFLSE